MKYFRKNSCFSYKSAPHQYPFDVFPFNPAVISLNVILVFPSLSEFDFSAHVLQYAVFLPDMIHTQ